MNETAMVIQSKRTVGRPAIPFDRRISPLRVFLKNGLIRRLEQAAPDFATAHTDFAEMVIERGLDALEYDQTPVEADPAVTYPLPQE